MIDKSMAIEMLKRGEYLLGAEAERALALFWTTNFPCQHCFCKTDTGGTPLCCRCGKQMDRWYPLLD